MELERVEVAVVEDVAVVEVVEVAAEGAQVVDASVVVEWVADLVVRAEEALVDHLVAADRLVDEGEEEEEDEVAFESSYCPFRSVIPFIMFSYLLFQPGGVDLSWLGVTRWHTHNLLFMLMPDSF